MVDACLAGEGTIEQIAIQYKIPAYETVRSWIMKYHNLETLKDYEVYMKDCSRKTTQEEQEDVVRFQI